MDGRVEPIVLSGMEAEEFIRNVFFPNAQEYTERTEHLEKIKSQGKIKDIENGWEAEIEDLDLSFLDENTEKIETYFESTFSKNIDRKS